jgi:hypothetical protein
MEKACYDGSLPIPKPRQARGTGGSCTSQARLRDQERESFKGVLREVRSHVHGGNALHTRLRARRELGQRVSSGPTARSV